MHGGRSTALITSPNVVVETFAFKAFGVLRKIPEIMQSLIRRVVDNCVEQKRKLQERENRDVAENESKKRYEP